MTNTIIRDQYSGDAQEIALSDIAQAFVRIRVPLLVIVLACGVLALTAAFVMTPVYRATVVMMPARQGDDTDRFRGIGGQLGSLAALVGVGGNESARIEEALAILKSRLFMDRFIVAQDLMPILFEELWDTEKGGWTVDDAADIPTSADGIFLMDGSIRSIIRDNNTGLLSVHIDWRDPEQAALWANAMIEMVNRHLRDRAIEEAEKSLAYLDAELSKTTSIEARTVIYSLMESQIQNIMFANVLEEYAFKVIDPAVSPEIDSFIRPNRPLLIVLGFVAGMVLATVIAMLAAFREKKFLVAG